MNHAKHFAAEVAPALSLQDVTGRRHPVASAELAEAALRVANELQALAGTGRTSEYRNPDAEAAGDTILLFYSSDNGRAGKGEISRAAKEIARSDVTLEADGEGDASPIRISGTRAVVFAERPAVKTGAVPFLVSTRIWFNENRSTVNFPAGEAQIRLALADINDRLKEGRVSLAR